MSIGSPLGYELFEQVFEELQILQIDQKKRIDTRRTFGILDTIKSFLNPQIERISYRNFKKNKARILKATLDLQDSDGYTPLHLASFYGQYQLVILYLSHNCETSVKDYVHNKEPIEYSKNRCIMKAISGLNNAIQQNDRKKFEFLLNSGFSIEENVNTKLSKPIQSALNSKEREDEDFEDPETRKQELFLNVILKCGADINSTDSDGWTSLHHSCKSGIVEHVLVLLKNLANFNIFSNHGYYPIHIAALHNNYEIIEILHKEGADLNVRDNDRCTPLMLAAKKGHKESIKTLLDLGAKLYLKDRRRWTSLHYASFNGRNRVVRLLCEYDDDFDKLKHMKNSQDRYALDLAKKQKTKKYFQSKFPH